MKIHVYYSGNKKHETALAYYNGSIDLFSWVIKFLYDSDKWGEMKSVPSLPYMVMRPDVKKKDNWKIIAIHELFHHYQHYFCGNGEYGQYKADRFTVDTSAHLAAAKLTTTKNYDNLLTQLSFKKQ